MKLLVLVFLTVLPFLPARFGPRDQSSSPPEQKAFSRVERIGEANARSFFVFATSVRSYTIRHDGLGEGATMKGLRRKFDLKVAANARLERVYFLEHDGDLLLTYEVRDGRSGWGYMERIAQNTLKRRWVTPVSGTNIGPALVELDQVYLSAANLFAKVDLRSGKYQWQQIDLEKLERSAPEEFQLPTISGDRVLFRELPPNGKIFELDRTTGKILEVRP